MFKLSHRVKPLTHTYRSNKMKSSLLSQASSQAMRIIAVLIVLPIAVSCTSKPVAQTSDNVMPASQSSAERADASEASTVSLEPTQTELASTNPEEVKSLAEDIGKLEVERVLQFVRYKEYVPPIVKLDERQSEVMTQLKQVAPSNYQALALSATREELKMKLPKLQAELKLNKDGLSASDQEVLQTQVSALKQRLRELPSD